MSKDSEYSGDFWSSDYMYLGENCVSGKFSDTALYKEFCQTESYKMSQEAEAENEALYQEELELMMREQIAKETDPTLDTLDAKAWAYDKTNNTDKSMHMEPDNGSSAERSNRTQTQSSRATPVSGLPRTTTESGLPRTTTPVSALPRVTTPVSALPRATTPESGSPRTTTPESGSASVGTPVPGSPKGITPVSASSSITRSERCTIDTVPSKEPSLITVASFEDQSKTEDLLRHIEYARKCNNKKKSSFITFCSGVIFPFRQIGRFLRRKARNFSCIRP